MNKHEIRGEKMDDGGQQMDLINKHEMRGEKMDDRLTGNEPCTKPTSWYTKAFHKSASL
jgi:hypothetical protein